MQILIFFIAILINLSTNPVFAQDYNSAQKKLEEKYKFSRNKSEDSDNNNSTLINPPANNKKSYTETENTIIQDLELPKFELINRPFNKSNNTIYDSKADSKVISDK
ncbi:MAG: hypothetical protein KBD64_07470 [Gammaproteobacteria bacterium]|nr:hypothetical protein [Gammaproteobacteria bacterium]